MKKFIIIGLLIVILYLVATRRQSCADQPNPPRECTKYPVAISAGECSELFPKYPVTGDTTPDKARRFCCKS